MKFSLNLIALLYLIIVGGICWIFPIQEIIKAFLALPGFLFVPYLIGLPSLKFLQNILKVEINLNKLSIFLLSFLLGVIILTLTALILDYLIGFNWIYYLIILGIFILSNFIILKNDDKIESKNIKINKIIFLVIFLGVISSFFISYFSPYPLFYGSDMFRHNYNTLNLVENNELLFDIPYIPFFTIFVSTILMLFKIVLNTFTIFWVIRFLTYTLFALGIFLFVNKFSNNKLLAIISSIISSWIIIESLGLWNFTPKLLIYLIFPFALYLITDISSRKSTDNLIQANTKNLIYLGLYLILITSILTFILYKTYYLFREISGIIIFILFALSLILIKISSIFKEKEIRSIFLVCIILIFSSLFIHLSMGFIMLFLLVIYSILLKFNPKFWNFKKILVFIFILIFINVLLNLFPIFEINIYGDAPNVLSTKLMDKYNYLFINLNLFSFFTLLGIILLFISEHNKKIKNSLILVMFSFIISIYFFPIGGLERVLTFLPIFASYISAYAIFILIRYQKKFIYGRLVGNLIILTFILILFGNLINYMGPFISQPTPYNHYSNFIYEEFKVGYFIKEITPINTIIISDPYTDAMVSGLSNRNKIGLLLRSSYYPEKYPQKNEIIRFLSEKDSFKAYIKIKELVSKKEFTCQYYEFNPKLCNKNIENIVVIFNKKTFSWIDKKSLNKKLLDKFYNQKYFTLIYENPESNIYIFGVNPELEVPFKLKKELDLNTILLK